jgi:hypothetical protein
VSPPAAAPALWPASVWLVPGSSTVRSRTLASLPACALLAGMLTWRTRCPAAGRRKAARIDRKPGRPSSEGPGTRRPPRRPAALLPPSALKILYLPVHHGFPMTTHVLL